MALFHSLPRQRPHLWSRPRNPSRAVVMLACQTHEARQSADNVTCIIAFFNPAGARGSSASADSRA